MTVEPVADSKHSHQWARLRFNVPASVGQFGIARYEVRTSKTNPIVPGDTTSFVQGVPGQAASVAAGGAS